MRRCGCAAPSPICTNACSDIRDAEEIDRSYALFHGIVSEAEQRGQFEPADIYSCRVEREVRVEDPHYTLRAWRAVVTYLLRQHEFLYE